MSIVQHGLFGDDKTIGEKPHKPQQISMFGGGDLFTGSMTKIVMPEAAQPEVLKLIQEGAPDEDTVNSLKAQELTAKMFEEANNV